MKTSMHLVEQAHKPGVLRSRSACLSSKMDIFTQLDFHEWIKNNI